MLGGQARLLRRCQLDAKLGGDSAGKIPLQRNEIADVPFVNARPQAQRGFRVNECAVIRSREPDRKREPSSTASTPSSRAISGIDFWLPR